jgi:glycosyltransferase involved in cell wall biosynthesis
MRILFHGAYPDMPTGYASQAAEIIPRLAAVGHQVAISATAGVESHPITWRNFPVFPKTPYSDFGEDVVNGHYREWKADLVITFMCVWVLRPEAWRDMRTLHLTPVDCSPMSIRDWGVIVNSGGMPAAISRFGETQMRRRGLEPVYLPHGVNTSVFVPPEDRAGMREALGLSDRFVVGMNFMNNDKFRKNIPEQLYAFRAFHARHPDSMLAIHSIAILPEGYNLPALVAHLGLSDCVIFSDQYQLVTGMASPAMLANWYGTCDVLLECGNEGFGLCRLEAQACGTPVITTSWGTGPELAGPGWKVRGQAEYNDVHQADWQRPFISSITGALERAYQDAEHKRDAARQFALGWDINRIVAEHWEPVLDDLT